VSTTTEVDTTCVRFEVPFAFGALVDLVGEDIFGEGKSYA
jgi:hypothetical protein